MPNNDNNNFEFPNLNNNSNNDNNGNNGNFGQVNSGPVNNQPLIEIPQEYYDKIAKEKEDKARAELEHEKQEAEAKEAQNLFGKVILLVLLNAGVIFFLINAYLKYNEKLIIAIPVYVIVMALIMAIKDKKESLQSLAIMIGGMGVAVVSFLISAVDTKQVDLWSYYAIASAVVAFVGLIITGIITKVIADRKSIKALQTVGMVILVAALVGLPYYFYHKNPEEVYRLVFQKKAVVKAETEDEYILKTLNNRYNMEFICDPQSVRSSADQQNRRIDQRLCYDVNTLKNRGITESNLHSRAEEVESERIIVESIVYDENKTQYIVKDDYMDVLMLRKFKEKISGALKQALSANNVVLYLYPEENCTFIGDCTDNKDYYEHYAKEVDADNQFNSSSKIDFSKYVTMNDTDFVNEYKFKYIIFITSPNFGTEDTYQPAVDKTLEQLDKMGLKNNYGYLIRLYNIPSEKPIPMSVYEIEGDTNSTKTFIG